MSLYEELREKYPRFVYRSYTFEGDHIEFRFEMGEEVFTPRWTFSRDISGAEFDRELADRAAFSLGMAELVSYWKCACPPVVEVCCGGLSRWEREWWKKLYFNGLGEFFYRNGITPDRDSFMTILAPVSEPLTERDNGLSGVLVPIGGGKDSIVTLELLKKSGADVAAYIINPRGTTLGCAKTAGIAKDKITAPSRTIDGRLLELNKRGYLNGHTPFSAVVAFSSVLAACIGGRKYVALSNESSANEAYVEGTSINHQYSKSAEFERDFRDYCRKSFGGFSRCPEYFSLLRPWSEWQIASEFVKHPRYFGVFRSCNLGSKKDEWCCACAKCLYVYILLAAFLDDGVLEEIFGCNMLRKTELAPELDGLMLDGEDKPFECVGTKAEVRLSLKMALDMRRDDPPALLRRFAERFPDYRAEDLSDHFDKRNYVPAEFLPLLGGKNK